MTKNDVIMIFASKLVDHERIDLGGGVTVDIDVFATLFTDAPANPTYAQLIAIDAGVMGYKPFFDQCKTEGILL